MGLKFVGRRGLGETIDAAYSCLKARVGWLVLADSGLGMLLLTSMAVAPWGPVPALRHSGVGEALLE